MTNVDELKLNSYKALGTVEEIQEKMIKFEKIEKILRNYEKTFSWGCNDSVHPVIADAIYGVVEDKNYFLEGYFEFLEENFK